MNNAIRLAPWAACFSLLLLGCEREEAVLAPEIRPLASASPLTSVVTDPEGDVLLPEPLTRQAYQDIVKAEITKRGSRFVFTMEMAGPVPEAPDLTPPGVTLLEWRWGLNTDPATFPAGFPNASNHGAPAEYQVQILWDGTSFLGQLIDRTPLLTGGEAIVTPLAFTIKGVQLQTSVGAKMVGDPSSFLWVALTMDWPTPLGTDAFQNVDFAPDFGQPQATWP